MKRTNANQKMVPLLCVLAAVLVLLIVLAVVLGGTKKPDAPDQTTEGAVMTEQQPSENDPTEDLVIQTPYCDLIYPGQWREHLTVEQVAGTEHDVNFYAAFAGIEKIHLFSVTFSPDTDDAVTVIRDANGNDAGVYIHISEVTVQLSDDKMNEIYSMQEMVNDLLDQLNK